MHAHAWDKLAKVHEPASHSDLV